MKYLIAVLVSLVAYLSWQNHELESQISTQKTASREFENLGDGVYSSRVENSSKDEILLDEEISVIAKKIPNQVKSASSVSSITSTANIEGTNVSNSSSSHQTTNVDKQGEVTIVDHLELVDQGLNGAKVGRVSYSYKEKSPWSYELFPRQLKVSSLLLEDENGQKSLTSRLTVSIQGNDHVLDLSDSTLKVSPEIDVWRYSPKLSLGLGISVLDPSRQSLNVGLSFLSYGIRTNPQWLLGTLGVGANSSGEWQVSFDPVSYRLSKHLPFTDSLYIGPSVSVGPAGYDFSAVVRIKL
jgi:hypothetical protein